MGTVVVVGGSVAGMRAAQALRERGYAGALLVVGAEPMPAYRRPALSKEFLTATPGDIALATPEDLAVDLLLGTRAVHLDPAGRTVWLRGSGDASARPLRFDGMVIATGARGRRPPDELAGVHVLRELADARRLRAELSSAHRVVVVGGGFVGCEVAASCRALGLEVTVVEAGEHPMGAVVGPRVGAVLAQAHRDNGVVLQLGVPVASLRGTDRVRAVELADGRELPADVVVYAVGAVPNTGWLAGSGLPVAGGVRCAPNLAVTE